MKASACACPGCSLLDPVGVSMEQLRDDLITNTSHDAIRRIGLLVPTFRVRTPVAPHHFSPLEWAHWEKYERLITKAQKGHFPKNLKKLQKHFRIKFISNYTSLAVGIISALAAYSTYPTYQFPWASGYSQIPYALSIGAFVSFLIVAIQAVGIRYLWARNWGYHGTGRKHVIWSAVWTYGIGALFLVFRSIVNSSSISFLSVLITMAIAQAIFCYYIDDLS